MKKISKLLFISLLILVLFLISCGKTNVPQIGLNKVIPQQSAPIEIPKSTAPSPPPTSQPVTDVKTVSQNVKEFNVLVTHTSYTPNTITINKGDKVRLKAVSVSGTLQHHHGITIDEFNVNQLVDTEDANNPIIIEFTADKAGTFNIWCKTCWDGVFGKGHPDIRASLIVEA